MICAQLMGHRHLMNSSLQMLETNRDRYGGHGTAELSHFHMGIGDLNVFICQSFYILLFIKYSLLIVLTINYTS